MSYEQLIARLQRRIGLDPESIGLTTLRHGIDEACAALGARDPADLWDRVTQDDRQWQLFVDRMVVPETWLFRVPAQFEDLLRHLRQQLGDRRPLRILSLPCATGEEVYSIAATLLDGGFAAGSFDVLGIDVSEQAIATARAARYRASALRGQPINLNWFEWQDDALVTKAALQQAVRFRVGNILQPGVLAESERFDIIFCRNLLIYLDAESRRTALDRLLLALDPDGMIFAGQAEVLSSMDARLQPLPDYGPFSFIHRRSESAPASVATVAPRKIAASRPLPPASVKTFRASSPQVSDRPNAIATRALLLERARRAADAGDLEEARTQCRSAVADDPEWVEAWFLLGVVEMAMGALEVADQAFGRASYLDREHRDALLHRAALAERLGRAQEALLLRSQLQRLPLRDAP